MAVDRFATPLNGVAEAANWLSASESTFTSWVFGHKRCQMDGQNIHAKPVATTQRSEGVQEAALPFIGLPQAYALADFGQAGVRLKRSRLAVTALACEQLFIDGADLLYDDAENQDDVSNRGVVVVQNKQRVVSRDLRGVGFGTYGYAVVRIDADRAFGRLRLASGAAKLEDAIELFQAGEPVEVAAEELRSEHRRGRRRLPCRHQSSRVSSPSTTTCGGASNQSGTAHTAVPRPS
ncbi:hypothetical protein ACIBHY_33270 [Nonomuraea sp. NPDC050547]|uniref:hypothetical protein n=1 Tax=Nonomuraea sp. NPDC050547 TaxID=3364368 RepID=UPI00378B7107